MQVLPVVQSFAKPSYWISKVWLSYAFYSATYKKDSLIVTFFILRFMVPQYVMWHHLYDLNIKSSKMVLLSISSFFILNSGFEFDWHNCQAQSVDANLHWSHFHKWWFRSCLIQLWKNPFSSKVQRTFEQLFQTIYIL